MHEILPKRRALLTAGQEYRFLTFIHSLTHLPAHMFLSRVSIQRPVLATMMNLVLVLFGLIGLSRLPVRELPDIDPPIVSVTTVYPGANAEVVETEVTERLEEQINNIEGIKTLRSESCEGVSNITIEFDLSRAIDIAAQDVRDRVSRVRGNLPQDIR